MWMRGKRVRGLGLFIISRSHDCCSEFVRTGPADSYLSEASPRSADQPDIHSFKFA